MATPILGMLPPSGWHYIEGDVRINGVTYDALIKNVEVYRAENHLPSGDVEGDVNSFVCSNWPQFCHGVDMVAITSVNPETDTTALLNDIQTWAKNLQQSQNQINMVTDELAEARAKTCRNCPENLNWRGGCSSCISTTERLTASVRQGRDTQSSGVLGGCRSMRHDNRTAIFIDKDNFSKSTNLPANCWLNI